MDLTGKRQNFLSHNSVESCCCFVFVLNEESKSFIIYPHMFFFIFYFFESLILLKFVTIVKMITEYNERIPAICASFFLNQEFHLQIICLFVFFKQIWDAGKKIWDAESRAGMVLKSEIDLPSNNFQFDSHGQFRTSILGCGYTNYYCRN